MTARREWSVLAKILGLALVAVLGACEGDGGGIQDPDGQIVPELPDDPVLPPPDDDPPPVLPETCAEIALFVRSVNPGDATEYALDVTAVEVWGDGGLVPVSAAHDGLLDLLGIEDAFLLGRIAMPESPATLHAVIWVAGGAIAVPGREVLLDPLSPPMIYPILTTSVAVDRCKVVLSLDLAGSLGEQDEADLPLVFLPKFGVRY